MARKKVVEDGVEREVEDDTASAVEAVTPEPPTFAEGYATAIADVLARLDEMIERGPAGESGNLKSAREAILGMVS